VSNHENRSVGRAGHAGRRWQILRAGVAAAATLLAGCTSWIGPDVLRNGRPAYNDAILRTEDEQLLQNIVRMRFHDSLGFLTVASVTANVSFTSTGTVNLGFGPTSNYAGNLVPFTGTISTEQNPTISYTPVSGDHILKQFAAEVPLDRAILLINSAHQPQAAWRAVVRRVNNLRNPDFPEPPTLVADARFDEVIELASVLKRHGTLYFVRLAGAKSGYAIVLHSYSPHNSQQVARLLDLLKVTKPTRDGDDVVIPVELSVGAPAPDAISLETRSLLDLLRLAAASVEVPPGTPGAGAFSRPGPAAAGFRIRSAEFQPADARVSAQYRGRWYYIDNEDEASKQWFAMLQLLSSAQLPDTAAGTAPVLTIPVTSRR
jgi:hypothetical protein